MTARTRDELIAIAQQVLEHADGTGVEAIARDARLELTRFAANAIHQNVAESGLQLRARVIAEDRVGVAEIRSQRAEAPRLVAEAAETARRIKAAVDVAPLPEPDGQADSPVAFSEATSAASPEARADMVATLTGLAARKGLRAYGYVSTQTTATAVLNTTGVRRAATSTQASMIAVVRGENGSGYAARHSPDIESIDAAELAEEAVETCERNQGAAAFEPGVYEVVISPYAVAELLGHLSWVGFSALAKQEHRTFMRLGERMMSEAITVSDDCRTDDLFPYPFDDEGVSTRVMPIIDRGVCANFVYDTPTAARDGVQSTGHSLPQPNTWGPFARHMVMSAGDESAAELTASVQRGLYVTRFWYVRNVHPLRTVITGMTRDGTFLIENGKLGEPVRDLRFTQSMVDALADVRGVSRERMLELEEGESGVLAPWLHLGHFAFTS